MKQAFLLSFLCAAIASYAAPLCNKGAAHGALAKTTVADAAEDNYDVHYVKMDLHATNLSTAISGHVITRATVMAASLQEYVFELSSQLVIDSILIDGENVGAGILSGLSVRKVQVQPIAQGADFTADVYYHGAPSGGGGFFTNGMLHGTDPGTGDSITFTVSAAVHSSDWWPCKQSLRDKIDSSDMWITVPAGNTVAGNGLLQQVQPAGTAEKRFEWSVRYPADYYLLSFAIAPYNEYSYTMHFDNSPDTMLIQNFLYPSPAVLQDHEDELDSIALMINYFSGIFGRYPFDKEKFGICQAPLGGGMENQTMVSLGSLDAELIAHELSHQWWGDNVTCGTLQDMWMNEGWASYCEELFIEHFRGAAAGLVKRSSIFNTALSQAGGSVYVSDTTDELRIYDGVLTYSKGAAVAHMLRYMINDDPTFFGLLRQYHQQYRYGTATTEDFKALAEAGTGLALDSFFNQWIYKEGYPVYSARWYQNPTGEVLVRLSHTTSKPSSITQFDMPVEIRLTSTAGDTVIRLMNDKGTQNYSFHWSKTMTGMSIDPDNNILNKIGTIVKDATLGISTLQGADALQIFPNPARTGWSIRGLAKGMSLALTNAAGQTLWNAKADIDTVLIPAENLPSAAYILTVATPDGETTVSYHLMKQ